MLHGDNARQRGRRCASPILLDLRPDRSACAIFATQAGIAVDRVVLAARYALGVSPTISVNRELNEPSEVQPTAMHASVTLHRRRAAAPSPARSGASSGSCRASRRRRRGTAARSAPATSARALRHGRDVERLGVLAVDQVARPAQVREVGEFLRVHSATVPPGFRRGSGSRRMPCRGSHRSAIAAKKEALPPFSTI